MPIIISLHLLQYFQASSIAYFKQRILLFFAYNFSIASSIRLKFYFLVIFNEN